MGVAVDVVEGAGAGLVVASGRPQAAKSTNKSKIPSLLMVATFFF